MAPLTYKRRQRAFEGADNRAKAIKRFQDEVSVRGRMRALREGEKMRSMEKPPNQQQAEGEVRRRRANREREITSHGGALPAPRAGGDRPRHMTTRGPRRLSFKEAYSRRTTDSSRQRVLELYGRKRPPKNSNASFQPVKTSTTPEQQAAEMRARAQKQRRRLAPKRTRVVNY